MIDSQTGFLVRPQDPPALAAAIIALAGDEKLRERMGAAGRQQAGYFTIWKMADRVAAVYDEILDRA